MSPAASSLLGFPGSILLRSWCSFPPASVTQDVLARFVLAKVSEAVDGKRSRAVLSEYCRQLVDIIVSTVARL